MKEKKKMNQRENVLALLRREPFEWIPAEFSLCPSLVEEYRKQTGSEAAKHTTYMRCPLKGMDSLSELRTR